MAIIGGNVRFGSPHFPAALCMRCEPGLRVTLWDAASSVHLKFYAHNTGFISHLRGMALSSFTLAHFSIFCIIPCQLSESNEKIFFLFLFLKWSCLSQIGWDSVVPLSMLKQKHTSCYLLKSAASCSLRSVLCYCVWHVYLLFINS